MVQDLLAAKVTLYSYVVARDYGFAPNPYYGYCTLANCKQRIRKHSRIGDWVVGTGGTNLGKNYVGKLIYAMEINEKLTYNEYWNDPRFQLKKPVLNANAKRYYGDNIYYQRDDASWHQSNSHHSLEDGQTNQLNLGRDTSGIYVLVSSNFYYFGRQALSLPSRFQNPEYAKLHFGKPNHRCFRVEDIVTDFLEWLQESAPHIGLIDLPVMGQNINRYDGKR